MAARMGLCVISVMVPPTTEYARFSRRCNLAKSHCRLQGELSYWPQYRPRVRPLTGSGPFHLVRVPSIPWRQVRMHQISFGEDAASQSTYRA